MSDGFMEARNNLRALVRDHGRDFVERAIMNLGVARWDPEKTKEAVVAGKILRFVLGELLKEIES